MKNAIRETIMATGRTDGIKDANPDSDDQGNKVPLTSNDSDTTRVPAINDHMTASTCSLGSLSLGSSQILEEKTSGILSPSIASPLNSVKVGLGSLRYSPHASLQRQRSASKGSTKAPAPSPLRVPGIPFGFPAPMLDQSLISVVPPSRPVESRSIKDYVNLETLRHETSHVVSKVVTVSDEEVQLGYLKHNAPGSFISQLEAMCAAFYRLIAPDHAPDVYAVYEDKEGVEVYTGVVSHELVGFKSAAVDPLKDEDLNIDHLADRNVFFMLDGFDDDMRLLEKAAEALDRKLKKLEQNDQQLQGRLNQLRATGLATSTVEIDGLKKKFRTNTENKMNLFDELAENTKRQHELYNNLARERAVSKAEFERYRIVKGLAIGSTASYIFVEVDLNQNNMSKDGKRIDFDMSLWHLFWEFKDPRIIDFFKSRKPASNVLDLTKNDIRNFPDLKDVSPYYWPTTSYSILSEAQREFIKNFIPFAADNPYSAEANGRYKKLAKNKVFVYHKFATFLKYILTSADMYRHIAQLHLSKDSYSQSRPLMDGVVHSQAQRIQALKDRLLSMPEFTAFIAAHGDGIFERIKASFVQQNEDYEDKVAELEAALAELQLQHDSLGEMNSNLLSKSTEALPGAPVRTQIPKDIIKDYSNHLNTIDTLELKQAREEQRIQFEMIHKNEQELKKIVDKMDRITARIAAYNRQKIDLEDVTLMYKNISERSKAAADAVEKEPLGVRVERANSVSSPVVMTSVSTPAPTPTSTQLMSSSFTLSPPVPKVIGVNTATIAAATVTSTSSVSTKEAVLGYFGLGYFGKSTPPAVKPATPKPNDFLTVQQLVLKLLYDYMNPGLLRFGGYNRSNIKEAQQLETFCKNLKAEPATDLAANVAAISQVKTGLQELKVALEAKAQAKLEAKIKERAATKSEAETKSELKLEPGELLLQVTNFLNDDIWKIQQAEDHHLSGGLSQNKTLA
jgi:hypothetical protein